MDILPEPISFDWDAGNINHLSKHEVSPQEAEEIFSKQPPIAPRDMEHSVQERRYFILGKTRFNRRLFAIFTIRKSKVRVISARDMTQAEEDAYEELESNS